MNDKSIDLTMHFLSVLRCIREDMQKLVSELQNVEEFDQKWISVGEVDFEKALMAFTRSVLTEKYRPQACEESEESKTG